MIILYSIPVLNMRFLANKTYFQDLWIGFIVLGGLFVGLGVIIFKRTLEISSEYDTFIGKFQVLNKGMYEIVRHPIYLSIILMFIGLSFVFDSVLSVILIPFIIILFEVQAYYEEKLLFMKYCEKEYNTYKEKTPKRLMVPSPLNVFLIIIGFFVVYLGMVNFESIFA
ncbi:MAG: methyltransferase family protein [Promethearchaeota archaeon]